MAPFPLFLINPTLLEKVVAKVEWKSYIRLQQTCKGAREFIQASKNINVHVFKTINMKLDDDGKVVMHLDDKDTICQDMYGCQVPDFGHFYDTCEKFRITSVTLSIIGETIGNPGGFNKEQCSLLVKLLKPVNVFIISTRSNRFEALLDAKQMKCGYMNITDLDTMVKAMETLTGHCQYLFLNNLIVSLGEEIYELLTAGLQALLARPLPIDYLFGLKLTRASPLPSIQELLDRFDAFRPTVIDSSATRHTVQCQLGDDLSCKLYIGVDAAGICFRDFPQER